MTAARLIDADGHEWPITGYWCTVCGLPLIRSTYGQTAHPNCREEVNRG